MVAEVIDSDSGCKLTCWPYSVRSTPGIDELVEEMFGYYLGFHTENDITHPNDRTTIFAEAAVVPLWLLCSDYTTDSTFFFSPTLRVLAPMRENVDGTLSHIGDEYGQIRLLPLDYREVLPAATLYRARQTLVDFSDAYRKRYEDLMGKKSKTPPPRGRA
jgi:hypothetical protein